MVQLTAFGDLLGWGPAIAFLAALLQTATGFGFSLIATPLLLLVYEPQTAIQLNIILGIAVSLAVLPGAGRNAEGALLWRMALGALLGAPLGLAIFRYGEVALLKGIVAALALLLALLLALKFSFARTPGRDYGIGAVSGLLTTSIGVPGPPLMLYFSGGAFSKQAARATTLAFFLFAYGASLVFQVAGAGFADGVGAAALICLPLTLLGVLTGQLIFGFINQRIFVRLIWALLVATGLYLLRTLL
ncbi:MAG: sulfite exporter TauE/SafE family protein [Dichotomicrobium sp.]